MAERDPSHAAALRRSRSRQPWRRTWAVALVTFRQGMRMRLWVLVPTAVVILVLADLSSPRFDPVFESVPGAVSTALLVMAVFSVVFGVFYATYSIPAEMDAKVSFSVLTKPVSRLEVVFGKGVGLSVLLLVMLGLVGLGGYGYVLVRSGSIRSLARDRLEEARPRAVHPADLNALEAAARDGPLSTYRYQEPDAGPEIGIDFGPAGPPEGDARWVLAETGMRLRWDLSQTPVREWVAAGPGHLRIRIEVRPPPGEPAEPPQAAVILLSKALTPDLMEAGDQKPVTEVVAAVSEGGWLEVPVAAWEAPPVKGVLNAVPVNPLTLDVIALTPGHVLGGREEAVTIEGPGGQRHQVKAAPEVIAGVQAGKAMIFGRPEAPRQAAVFRFADVPAAGLGPGNVAVEIGFTLDAWSPVTVQPAAEMTFTNPATGDHRTFRFTPEGHHSTLLHLEREFWHGGPLEARLECLTKDDSMGLLPASVRLRLAGGPFALHLARAVLCVWLFGSVIIAAAVFWSARFSWFVSILGTIVVCLLSMIRDFLLGSTPVGAFARWLAVSGDSVVSWSGWPWLVQRLVPPVPDLPALLPPESVNLGQVIAMAHLAEAFGWAALACLVLMLLGTLLLKTREVAA